MTTTYFIHNKKGNIMGAVDTEAEAKAIITKNEKRGWTYKAITRKTEGFANWELAGYNADPPQSCGAVLK